MHSMRCTVLLALAALAAAACIQLASAADAVPLSAPAPAAPRSSSGGSSEPGIDLLMKGAGLCMRGPSPTCCGLMNVVLGNAQSPLAK